MISNQSTIVKHQIEDYQDIHLEVIKQDFETILTNNITKGDTIFLREGDIVPADIRIIWSENLVVDDAYIRELNQYQRATIIYNYKENKHVVAYLGNGYSDVVAIKRADVGITLNNASGVAKAFSDIIMNEKKLTLGQFVVRQDLESLLYFTISTGIGSGFILDGKIYNGYSQTACEIANALPNSKSENPTKSGIEFLASGINIPKQLEKIGVKVDDAKDAFILYNSKTNKKVNDYFESLKEEYIKLFSTAIYFLNPQIIVLGGSVAMNNQEFFNDIFIKVIDVTKDINYKTKFEYAKDLDQATVLACSKL
ncbi:hypothetical protein FQR65_LT19331 [Abscondita terminalis]|nr:hypothetical protein FQR65_LT19331 [Abscondita terminalis]